MLLSVLMPVYNEEKTIRTILKRVREAPLPRHDMQKQIVIVDDGSTDATREILDAMRGDPDLKIIFHKKNGGKGTAVRTAIENATGDIYIIQDADLEYDPQDYGVMLTPILEDKSDAVYGSRFKGSGRAFLATHYYGNQMITFIANILYNTCLTDLETCYKAFKCEIFDTVRLKSKSFTIEPEITAKLFKNKFRVFEVPISYSGRDFEEGKKITWRDGFKAIGALFYYRFRD